MFPLFQFAPTLGWPWLVLLLGGGFAVYRFYAAKSGELTAERKIVFSMAMRLTDPSKLQMMASEFDKAGLKDQASQLRNRAALQTLPKDQQAARAAVLKQALSSTNVDGILAVADAFQAQGAQATADLLRQYANGLKASQSVTPQVVSDDPSSSGAP